MQAQKRLFKNNYSVTHPPPRNLLLHNNLCILALLLLAMLGIFMYSCDPDSDDGDGGPTTPFVASKIGDHPNFILLSIGTGKSPNGEYTIGVRVDGNNAPMATELTGKNVALTRNLSSTKKTVYLPFHLDGTFFDGGAKDFPNAKTTMLSPSTKYHIYVTKSDNSGTVENVLTFTTSGEPNDMFGIPNATVTVRSGEPFLAVIDQGGTYNRTSTVQENSVITAECGSTVASCSANPAAKFTYILPTTNADLPETYIYHDSYPATLTSMDLGFQNGSKAIFLKIRL